MTKNKKYVVVYENDVFLTLEEVANDLVKKGKQLRYRIFEVGQEFEIDWKKPEIKVIASTEGNNEK